MILSHRNRYIIKCVTISSFLYLLFIIGNSALAVEEKPATLTGRVITTYGEPIPATTVVLLYVKLREYSGLDPLYNRSLYPFLRQRSSTFPDELREGIPDEQQLLEYPPFIMTETNSEGEFTIKEIVSGTVQLMVLSEPIQGKDTKTIEPKPKNITPIQEIRAIRYGKAFFYPHQFPFSPETSAVTFTIKPGSDIEDIDIIMNTQEKKPINVSVSGKIQFLDGTPLANASLEVEGGRLSLDTTEGYPLNFNIETDSNGMFNHSVYSAGIHGWGIKYRGLTAYSELFYLSHNQHHEGMILTLNGNPNDITDVQIESVDKVENQYNPISNIPTVWVVNPENKHAYKAVICESGKEAEEIAIAENAYLLSITSEEEQNWLNVVYKNATFWLGLIYSPKEKIMKWDSGEALDYTNWLHMKLYGPAKSGNDKHYAISSWNGKWRFVDFSGSPTHKPRIAIIEKDIKEVTRK